LRAKQYSFKMWEDSSEHKRCKGIRKNVVKNRITHDDYNNCLLNREEQMRKMNVIRSHLHHVYTEEVNKVALSAEDDKRVIMENGIHTLAYGHYSLKTEGEDGISWIYVVREIVSSGNDKKYSTIVTFLVTHDVITSANFCDCRLWGLSVVWVKFWFSPLTRVVALTTLSHYRASV